MGVLGQTFKEKREQLGLTIDQLSEKTGIQARYLQAIESENLDIIPGEYYVNQFIRQYGEALQLNGEKILQAHKKELEEKEKAAQREAEQAKVAKLKPERSKKHTNQPIPPVEETNQSNRWYIIVLLTVLSVFALAIYFIPRLLNNPETKQNVDVTQTTTTTTTTTTESTSTTTTINTTSETTETTTAKEEPKTETTTPSNQGSGSSSNATEGETEAKLYTKETTKGAITYGLGKELAGYKGNYNFTVSVTEPTWVSITIHNKVVYEGIIRPNAPRKGHALNNASKIVIKTGISTATSITLNGNAVAVPTDNRVETVTIDLAK